MPEELQLLPTIDTSKIILIPLPLPLSAPLPAGDELTINLEPSNLPSRAFLFPLSNTKPVSTILAAA